MSSLFGGGLFIDYRAKKGNRFYSLLDCVKFWCQVFVVLQFFRKKYFFNNLLLLVS